MSEVTEDSSETPAGATDATMVADLTAADEAAADVPPELVAQSLGQYLRASWARVRGGNSGVLPVVLAIVVVAISFQIANSKFLSAQNLVNLFEQSTIYMLLAIAEIFALLLGEIDLSVGLIMGLGSVVVAELVQPTGARYTVERGMRVCFFVEEPAGRDLPGAGDLMARREITEAEQQRLDRYKQRRDEYLRKLAHLAPPLSEEQKARLAVLLAPAAEEYRRRKTP